MKGKNEVSKATLRDLFDATNVRIYLSDDQKNWWPMYGYGDLNGARYACFNDSKVINHVK